MADRIVVMSKGKIEQLGTPLEIYNTPQTQFVAGFFGTPTMNFIEGTIEADGATKRFRGPGIDQPLPDAVASTAAGCKTVLGVRSEHVAIDASAPHSGTVRITEPLGDATLIHFDYGQGQTLVAKVPPTTALTSGAAVKFRFVPEACHLFDAASQARLN